MLQNLKRQINLWNLKMLPVPGLIWKVWELNTASEFATTRFLTASSARFQNFTRFLKNQKKGTYLLHARNPLIYISGLMYISIESARICCFLTACKGEACWRYQGLSQGGRSLPGGGGKHQRGPQGPLSVGNDKGPATPGCLFGFARSIIIDLSILYAARFLCLALI